MGVQRSPADFARAWITWGSGQGRRPEHRRPAAFPVGNAGPRLGPGDRRRDPPTPAPPRPGQMRQRRALTAHRDPRPDRRRHPGPNHSPLNGQRRSLSLVRSDRPAQFSLPVELVVNRALLNAHARETGAAPQRPSPGTAQRPTNETRSGRIAGNSGLEVAVDFGDADRPFADGAGHPLGRARADVPDREDARLRGLED